MQCVYVLYLYCTFGSPIAPHVTPNTQSHTDSAEYTSHCQAKRSEHLQADILKPCFDQKLTLTHTKIYKV